VTGLSRKRSRLAELWPADRLHLPVAGIAERFATYVYLPKPRNRMALETAIRDALARLDPKFAYAAWFDKRLGKIYRAPLDTGHPWQKPERADAGSRPAGPEVASARLRPAAPTPQPETNPTQPDEGAGPVP
jgi:hypothetical protein